MKEYLKRKVEFVEELNKVLPTYQTNISNIKYEVWKEKNNNRVEEFLVVTYVGLARSIICCNGDSISAIFRELSLVLDNGYYDDVYAYDEMIANNPNFEKEE